MSGDGAATRAASSPTPGEPGDPRPLILFDGVCNLCNATVQWVIERDVEGLFRFASLQSEAARQELNKADQAVDIGQLPDSIVLVDRAGIHTHSAAIMGIARRLGFPHSILGLGRVVPRPLRDAIYRFIARHRYRWFGRRDTCMTATPDLAARFLDVDEPRPRVPVTEEPLGGGDRKGPC